MKKLVLSATFVLASFGAFAANSDVKSNNTIVPVKNNVEETAPTSCDANINTGLFTIIIVWCC